MYIASSEMEQYNELNKDKQLCYLQSPIEKQCLCFKPSEVIDRERKHVYGSRVEAHALHRLLKSTMEMTSLDDVIEMTKDLRRGVLSVDDLDVSLLDVCAKTGRNDIARHLIDNCGARGDFYTEVHILSNWGGAAVHWVWEPNMSLSVVMDKQYFSHKDTKLRLSHVITIQNRHTLQLLYHRAEYTI